VKELLVALVDELIKLHDVQKIDTQIYQREQAILALDSGDSLKREAIALIKRADVAISTRQKLAAELHLQELALKSVEAKRDTEHERLYSGRVTNPKELRDMQHDEENLNLQISELEEPILDLMDRVEQAKILEATLAGQVSVAKRRWKETVAHTQVETERLRAEIAALRPERETRSAMVATPLLRRYDDIRLQREGIGFAVTYTDSCPACHIKLTVHFMRLLRAGEELLCCENCGRILAWLPE
jgi:predicted  nucleic acid-binding Zn-ribbon protein